MKANELMIGDWVYRPACYDQVKEIRYTGVIGIDGMRGVIAFSELEPIPLTPEILEKNGFIKERLYCHGTPLQYCVLVDGLWIDISGENFFEGKLDYVHQLQHALRLCGIDKEIEL